MDSFITVAAVKGRTIPSRMIEWFGGSGWSHFVAMLLPGGKEVIDARDNEIGNIEAGVQIRPVSYLNTKSYECLWLNIPCTAEQAAASEANLRSVLNRPYDQIGILDFVLGKSSDHSWKNESSFFCSDLFVWNAWKIGLLKGPLVPPTLVDPGEALAICWGLQAQVTTAPWKAT